MNDLKLLFILKIKCSVPEIRLLGQELKNERGTGADHGEGGILT